jgi:hypothetical protein
MISREMMKKKFINHNLSSPINLLFINLNHRTVHTTQWTLHPSESIGAFSSEGLKSQADPGGHLKLNLMWISMAGRTLVAEAIGNRDRGYNGDTKDGTWQVALRSRLRWRSHRPMATAGFRLKKKIPKYRVRRPRDLLRRVHEVFP